MVLEYWEQTPAHLLHKGMTSTLHNLRLPGATAGSHTTTHQSSSPYSPYPTRTPMRQTPGKHSPHPYKSFLTPGENFGRSIVLDKGMLCVLSNQLCLVYFHSIDCPTNYVCIPTTILLFQQLYL